MADKSIRAVSLAVAAMQSEWTMVQALMDGTHAMRKAGEAYLPKFPKEADPSYKTRLSTAVLHPVFRRTVMVNAARPFSKPMAFAEDAPKQITEDWAQDIDLQGTTLSAFCLQVMTRVLAKGLSGVLVESPEAGNLRTRAEEAKSGVRPYLAEYPPGQILGWRTQRVGSSLNLTQLRLLEYVEVADGAYQTTTVEQVRVLTPGAWETYQQNDKNPEVWDKVGGGASSMLDAIPFVFFYGMRCGFGEGRSPLIDLGYQNVEHWQSASDQQMILHAARVPILFLKKFGDTSAITIGAGTAIKAEDQHSDAKFVEHSGAAIGAGQTSLSELEDRMQSSGAELISLTPALQTATQVSSDAEAAKSLLQQIVEMFEESMSASLALMAKWAKLDGDTTVTLHKDFGIGSAADAPALASAVKAGALSRKSFFEELQRRDVISGDRDWDEEAAAIKADEPKEPADKSSPGQTADTV